MPKYAEMINQPADESTAIALKHCPITVFMAPELKKRSLLWKGEKGKGHFGPQDNRKTMADFTAMDAAIGTFLNIYNGGKQVVKRRNGKKGKVTL